MFERKNIHFFLQTDFYHYPVTLFSNFTCVKKIIVLSGSVVKFLILKNSGKNSILKV